MCRLTRWDVEKGRTEGEVINELMCGDWSTVISHEMEEGTKRRSLINKTVRWFIEFGEQSDINKVSD